MFQRLGLAWLALELLLLTFCSVHLYQRQHMTWQTGPDHFKNKIHFVKRVWPCSIGDSLQNLSTCQHRIRIIVKRNSLKPIITDTECTTYSAKKTDDKVADLKPQLLYKVYYAGIDGWGF